MRVVYLSTEAGLGGAERCLEELATGVPCRSPGWETHVVCLADGPLRERLKAVGIGTTLLPLPRTVAGWGEATPGGLTDRVKVWLSGGPASGQALAFSRSLRQTISSLRPDLLHSNGSKAHLLAALVRPARCRLVWHLHDFLGSRSISRLLLPLAARRVDAAVANSRAVRDDARTVLTQTPVEYVHNGIDLSVFRPGPDEGEWLDRLAGFTASSGTRIGLVATYAQWKGHRHFLEAAAQVKGDVRFFVIGGPIYRTRASQVSREELEAAVLAVGLQGRVGFVPFQSDVAKAYRGLDVVVHASTEPEPFGRTVVEAMACARAVIATAGGGAAELFSDGKDGIGVPARDVSALAEAMTRLALDSALRLRLGRAARASAELYFDVNRYVDQFLGVYRRVLGETRPASHPRSA